MKPIRIVTKIVPLTEPDLLTYLGQPFDEMVKFVVDLSRECMAIGGELHADAEAVLIDGGSSQENLWGANIYPKRPRETWLEYISLINIRPSQNNFGMNIQSELVREAVRCLVDQLIRP